MGFGHSLELCIPLLAEAEFLTRSLSPCLERCPIGCLTCTALALQLQRICCVACHTSFSVSIMPNHLKTAVHNPSTFTVLETQPLFSTKVAKRENLRLFSRTWLRSSLPK